jgi:hypothetical protein
MLRSTVLAGVGALLACAAVACAAVLFADLASARPEQAMRQWRDGQPMGSHAARQALLDRIAMAIAASPADAGHFLELGNLYAWHASPHARGTERHRLFTARARAAFAQARARRPTWGFAWVREAEQRALLGEPVSDLWPMLLRADLLSPREPETQLKLLWVGLRGWDELDARARERLRRSLARLQGDRRYGEQARRIARQHARQDLLEGQPVTPLSAVAGPG